MPVYSAMHGLEIHAESSDLIADYVPDASGRYRIYRVTDALLGDFIVTEISGDERFAERLTRLPEWDGDRYVDPDGCFGHESLDGSHMGETVMCDGSCNPIIRADYMLTERFGSQPDFSVAWIDGLAYRAEWEDGVCSVTTPADPADDDAPGREPTAAEIAAAITLAKGEILRDIREGRVPETVRSFSELHDYVDANEYGGLCDEGDDVPDWVSHVAAGNTVQNAVDGWLKFGRVMSVTETDRG